ncbi:uncharacterized protein LOC132705489 [Cylas formicarius]|uniref:uncharacterized protein LOC132705489 n=1 Tax=Cylas formicarius TaxID=197179 RepID=UPI0029586986|nr:uncharacterized protein LOC132705489 [Cylas formicarius]
MPKQLASLAIPAICRNQRHYYGLWLAGFFFHASGCFYVHFVDGTEFRYSEPVTKFVCDVHYIVLVISNLVCLLHALRLGKLIVFLASFDICRGSPKIKFRKALGTLLSVGLLFAVDYLTTSEKQRTRIYMQAVIRDGEYFTHATSGAIIGVYMRAIKACFATIAANLKLVVGQTSTGGATHKIKLIRKQHFKLCDLLDRFNSTFGVYAFSHVVCQTATIFLHLTVLVGFALIGVNLDPCAPAVDGLVSFAWIITSWFQATILAGIGHGIQKENVDILAICHKLSAEISKMPSTDRKRALKQETQIFVQQISCRDASISTGGIFVVNYKILGSILSIVTTYMVVCIQFMLRNAAVSGNNSNVTIAWSNT